MECGMSWLLNPIIYTLCINRDTRGEAPSEHHLQAAQQNQENGQWGGEDTNSTDQKGLLFSSIAGLLPQEAVCTIEFVYQVDRLFDCFNSAVMFHYKGVWGGFKS